MNLFKTLLSSPPVPVSARLGKNEALATPICALAATMFCSAWRTSGRRSSSCEGDSRVAHIQLSLFDCRLIGLDCCLRPAERLRVGIKLTLGDGVSFRLRNVALYVQVSVGHLRLLLCQLPFSLIERCLEWAGVDLKKNSTLLDVCPFPIILTNQVTAHHKKQVYDNCPCSNSQRFQETYAKKHSKGDTRKEQQDHGP